MILARIMLAGILFTSSIPIVHNTEVDFEQQSIECLAHNMYYEARGTDKRGLLAVGHVTINRSKSKNFPNNICGVVTQKHKKFCQFSWVCDKKLKPVITAQYDKIRTLAEEIYYGKHKDITYGATYFHNTEVFPEWAYSAKLTIKIGDHSFYKKS